MRVLNVQTLIPVKVRYLRTELDPVSVPLPEKDDFEGTLDVGEESNEYCISEIELGRTLK